MLVFVRCYLITRKILKELTDKEMRKITKIMQYLLGLCEKTIAEVIMIPKSEKVPSDKKTIQTNLTS